MKRSPARRMLFTVVMVSALPLILVAGCKKPPPPAPDAEPPPVVDAGILQLAPLEDDAGDAAAEADAKKTWTGVGMNPNEAKVRACCSRLQMTITAAGQMATPEMKALLGQCNAIAAAVKANPNAPELAGLKSIPGC